MANNRCLGLTQNFKRCKMQGAWAIFCDDHKYSWIKYLICICAFSAGLIEFIPNASSFIEKQFDDTNKFYGTWSEYYQYPTSDKDALIEVAGRVTYFENGKYNFTGRYTIQVNLPNGKANANYHATVTGTWIAENDYLTISLADKKFDFDSVTSPIGASFNELAGEYFRKNFSLNEKFLDGLSDQYRIENLSEYSIVIEGRDPNLDPIIIKMTRLDKPRGWSLF